MAHSFWVLVKREALPPPSVIMEALKKAKLPVSLSQSWKWDGHSGWLPMLWRKKDSGCEVELEKLTKKDISDAKKAGYSDFDSRLVVTTRGWDSLQCGVSFAAAVAIAAHGSIAEDDDAYIAPASALKWANTSIAYADKQLQQEQKEEQARAGAHAAGSPDDALRAALETMKGLKITDVTLQFSCLGVYVYCGPRIVGSAWRITGKAGKPLQQDQYAALRSRQLALLSSWESEPTPLQSSEYERLDRLLENAAQADKKVEAAAVKELKAWSKTLPVLSAQWNPPNIVLRFDGNTVIEFIATRFSQVTCTIPPLTFCVTDEGAKLL